MVLYMTNPIVFKNAQDSHRHSLETLEMLYRYDDFMESVNRVVDLGCGYDASDLKWWATRATRDETPIPLNIHCTGVDLVDRLDDESRKLNIIYQQQDIETWNETRKGFDILWCHNTFQYLANPIGALRNWWNIAADGAMLAIIVPQTTNIEFNQQAFDLPAGHYFNHTLVSLIHMLAVSGWDCGSGFFKKMPNDPWVHAVVYKSSLGPLDPRTTTWYHLAEKNLLPTSAVESVNKYGYVKQRDLVLPWLDKSLTWMGQQ